MCTSPCHIKLYKKDLSIDMSLIIDGKVQMGIIVSKWTNYDFVVYGVYVDVWSNLAECA